MEVTHALQAAAVAALKASPAVTALVVGRVLDRVTDKTAFPYINLSGFQLVQHDADCIDGAEVFFDVHVWSRTVARTESADIAGAVREVLHNATLLLTDAELTELEHRDTRYMRDPDGVTNHAVVTFRALVEAL
ncbi:MULTISPECIES: DUF3168 domain-containing protein [unclassified Chelatococcus]|uniref:DUF3168 domain-containing protein n=1 Tax=unclassified Chelatococcus TaxID=2638111 RepID=UPI001BCB1207|nr:MULTISPECIES: DUF3168 domain-containing protein [unclassified Chelatococcus]MBS7698771.1 DUF3168 domain-containing protein [Chelatococcus sp. YT9]MBX3554647.1 DUF3168 domain-containing protein [Chelatococcus sp.]